MRELVNQQMLFGEVDISQIEFNPKSRDDIPQILKGLQYIYITAEARNPIFKILEKEISPDKDKKMADLVCHCGSF